MKLTEFQLIERIQHLIHSPSPDVVCGIGDDCAVIDKQNGVYELLTTDCLIEGVHFDLKYFTPFEVGKKALAVNLSDIAAMGGKPRHALVSWGIPENISSNWLMDAYTGLDQMALEFNVSMVGGNLAFSPDRLWVSITLVGEVEKEKCKFRLGAHPHDALYVSGPLGSSAMGLALLKKKKFAESPFMRAHKTPVPELVVGHFLGGEKGVTSMIDVSDGLMGDLSHILNAGGEKYGAHLDFDSIPREKELESLAQKMKLSLVDLVLNGGEDYQLLFTVNPEEEKDFLKKSKSAGYQFSRIGSVMDQAYGIKVTDEQGKEIKISHKGFDHFKSWMR